MFLCTYCSQPAKKIVKGLCMACYTRQQRTGSLEYRRKGTFTVCTVPDCGKHARSHGLCGMHANRLKRHGHLEQTRPENWGVKNDHPLTEQWNYLHSRKGVELCAPEWRTDFDRFVADVGARPSPKHKLKPRDRSRLIGPDNFAWVAPEYERLPDESPRDFENRAERGRRASDPDKFRNLHLRKKYAGLSLAGVTAMSERQDHRCAICREKEGTVIRGQVIALAVDHDHDTGHIRGLLCVKCNRGLGLFRDSPELLQAAVGYLANPPGEIHKRTPLKRRAPKA